ncbi:MAG: ornithine cyclodeaminase family protein [Nitrososphaerota archaeon]|nr:ornithine cyclodeaminase family protein [Nitrososphaerota archaeon]MDG6942178.1 ornithine cyclodeaminase family protein [Nitrososphaerota archaeon]MDG6942643.1 ornithine cyclodeaminase family protein [Nitrososphaerota archaeon]MDG6948430.1 ornithine cyclodeaminase family protein [Nitrososphaerota archaeon]MDG6950356.1 ornithine cyclodeaminase family protein [Nitrososphaerota archaeon]
MTLVLSEKDVEDLIDMDAVVVAVEEAFRRKGMGEAENYMRTRTRSASSVLNVMHANMSYLGRAGLKAYLSSKSATKFVVVLFDAGSTPLAVMGADMLGRFRTGAASAVATKYLYRKASGTVALFGSGKQALTQALALRPVMSVDEVHLWSPNVAHREAFARVLEERGFQVTAFDSPAAALKGAEVVTTITSSREPFLDGEMLKGVAHANVCGSNIPTHAEISAGAVASFRTVTVDDLAQAKSEYGDLIIAAQAGKFSWDPVKELGEVVAGWRVPEGQTLFKSGGAAIEDVAVASALYDAARARSGFPDVDLV